jgi:hypothetical protein
MSRTDTTQISRSQPDQQLILQRHFVIMRVGFVGGNGSPGRWPDVVVAIGTSAAAAGIRAAAGPVR